MKFLRVKPFLICCVFSLVAVFAHAQQHPGEKILLARNFAKMKGSLPWPADNIRELITHKQAQENVRNQFHVTGSNIKTLTIRCDEATTVKAVADGIVYRIFNIEDSWTVLVKHDDYLLVYSNLDTVFLKNGDILNTMQPVGRITSRGINNYFELEMLLYQNRKNLDPYDWFTPIQKSELIL